MKKSHDCGASTKFPLLLILSRMERDGLGKVDEGPHFSHPRIREGSNMFIPSKAGRTRCWKMKDVFAGDQILREESG